MTKLELELIECIGKAKAHLKGARMPHSERCYLNLDPDAYACDCGVGVHNLKLEDAMSALDLEDLAD